MARHAAWGASCQQQRRGREQGRRTGVTTDTGTRIVRDVCRRSKLAGRGTSRLQAGVHSRFRMSRQISPVLKLTFGWKTCSLRKLNMQLKPASSCTQRHACGPPNSCGARCFEETLVTKTMEGGARG